MGWIVIILPGVVLGFHSVQVVAPNTVLAFFLGRGLKHKFLLILGVHFNLEGRFTEHLLNINWRVFQVLLLKLLVKMLRHCLKIVG